MYSPQEDSYFLSEKLKKFLENKEKTTKILDLGTGTCIQAETCRNLGFKNILCSDIDSEAIKTAKLKKFKAINSDLFEKIKGKFDLIIFNAPYLPDNKFDSKIDTSGGKTGDEIILKFLKQAKKHLNKKASILLLLSSFTPLKRILKLKNIYNIEKLTEKNIFFEKLIIFQFSES